MDDMKAMMQDELRQALARLMPPPAPVTANPPAAIVAPAVNPPAVDAPPANNDNVGDRESEDVQNRRADERTGNGLLIRL